MPWVTVAHMARSLAARSASFIQAFCKIGLVPDSGGTWLLPRLVGMEWMASYCLTEPGSGSDAAALKTTAVRDGAHFVVNGTKQFISGAGVNDLYLTMVRTGDDGPGGITCLAIEKDMPGVSFGAPERKTGWHAQPTASLILDNVRVPAGNMVGSEGEGFRIAMQGLDGGRLNIGACSLGGAQRCLDEADLGMDPMLKTDLGRRLKSQRDGTTKLPENDGLRHAGQVWRDGAAADDALLGWAAVNSAAKVTRNAARAVLKDLFTDRRMFAAQFIHIGTLGIIVLMKAKSQSGRIFGNQAAPGAAERILREVKAAVDVQSPLVQAGVGAQAMRIQAGKNEEAPGAQLFQMLLCPEKQPPGSSHLIPVHTG